MSAELLETTIHPAAPLGWWWWLVLAGLILAAAGLLILGITRWRRLRHDTSPEPDTTFDRLRADTLAALEDAAAADTSAETARLVGRALRRFAGLALDGDADYQTAGQLRVAALKDPRLAEVAALAARVDELAWGAPDEHATAELTARAGEVVSAWR